MQFKEIVRTRAPDFDALRASTGIHSDARVASKEIS